MTENKWFLCNHVLRKTQHVGACYAKRAIAHFLINIVSIAKLHLR